MVHDVAATGFGKHAEAYDAARPSYPPDAVAWLGDRLDLRPGQRVADVAAGTGKLTARLAPSGAHLVAVEPVAGMRQVLRRALPAVPVVAGTAEALPFADAGLDAVTVAQAFHWFDAPAALAEVVRVVRPGGGLGLVWNARDRTEDWVDRIWSVMDRVEKRAPWREHDEWRDTAFVDASGLTPLEPATFRQVHSATPDDVVARIASVSHVAVLPEPDRQATLAEVRAILATHPATAGRARVDIPYRVDAYVARRV